MNNKYEEVGLQFIIVIVEQISHHKEKYIAYFLCVLCYESYNVLV